jgi:hypothetical protein
VFDAVAFAKSHAKCHGYALTTANLIKDKRNQVYKLDTRCDKRHDVQLVLNLGGRTSDQLCTREYHTFGDSYYLSHAVLYFHSLQLLMIVLLLTERC